MRKTMNILTLARGALGVVSITFVAADTGGNHPSKGRMAFARGRRRRTPCFVIHRPGDESGKSFAAPALKPGDNMPVECGKITNNHGRGGKNMPTAHYGNASGDPPASINHCLCTRTATTPVVYR